MVFNGMTKHIRWQAFYTWCRGAYNIGYDLGQAIANLLPQGIFGLFFKVDPSMKIFDPAKGLSKFLLGPVIGAVFVVAGLIPAIIEGIILKRPFKKNDDDWATKLVANHGVKLVWGSVVASVMWAATILAGYSSAALSSAVIFPIAASYGLISLVGVANGLINLYGSMTKLYVWGIRRGDWQYALKTTVDIKLDQEPQIKNKLNEEFQYELEKMSELHNQAYARLVQENNHPPTSEEINKLGVLTYYGLLKEQSDFLSRLTQDKMLKSPQAKQAAIEERHQKFELKFGT